MKALIARLNRLEKLNKLQLPEFIDINKIHAVYDDGGEFRGITGPKVNLDALPFDQQCEVSRRIADLLPD